MAPGGHSGWFDQFYEPESVALQVTDTARAMVGVLAEKDVDALHVDFSDDDPEPRIAADLVDQVARALKLSLRVQLLRVASCSAAPRTVSGLPHVLVEEAVGRCESIVIDGEPGVDYAACRALRLNDLGTDWTVVVGVRELDCWVRHERLDGWLGAHRQVRDQLDLSPADAAERLSGRQVICVHVEHGDHPRFEHGYEQAELCLDDGSVVIFDAKDSTWVGEDTDLTVTVDGEPHDDLPRVLHSLVGCRIGDSWAERPNDDEVFAIGMVVGGKSLRLAARGDGATIAQHGSPADSSLTR